MSKTTHRKKTFRSSTEGYRGAGEKRQKRKKATLIEFGSRIKKLREDRGLYLHEVANKLRPKVWPQTVHKWENGEIQPPLGRLTELAKIFGCELWELLDDPSEARGRSA